MAEDRERDSSAHLEDSRNERTSQEDMGPAMTIILERQTNTDDVVASQVMPQASETGEDVSIYQLKWVEMGGVFVPIIVQNENGPCPLLALCNVLILRGAIKITPGNTDVSSTYLLDLLGTHLLEYNRTQQLTEGERANLEQNILDTMTIFPQLQTGLDVNVKFNSVSGFEFTRETGIFDLMGVPLYHGWVEDPQSSYFYQVVKNVSYNQLVEKIINNTSSEDEDQVQEALLGQQFLESTASQLTYHGLCELNTAMKEGEYCVFFRNNHFNTLTKKTGRLLTLVTDHGFLNELGYVWQTLSDIDGGGDFLDAKFSPSPQSESQTHLRQKQDQALDTKSSPDCSPVAGDTGSPAEQVEEPSPHKNDDDLDYQAALRLQQELFETSGREEEIEQQQQHQQLKQPSPLKTSQQTADHELAAALQQEEDRTMAVEPSSSGPNTAEEYEHASERERRRPSNSCNIL